MDWKKEIKVSDLFGRKPKVRKSSIPFWKREISLRRKRKPTELVPVADEDWVREQLALAAAAAAAPPAPAPGIHPPVPASELPPLPKEKKQSLLKREISFKRKPKAPKEPKPAAKPSVPKRGPGEGAPGKPGGSPGGVKPFWKQELSLSRKPKAKQA